MSATTVLATAQGVARGIVEGSVRRFSGLPFATAARFRRPRAFAWDGTLDATGWGPAPWQPLPAFDDPAAPFDEQCLNAAVWAPRDVSEPLPVLVWVYGGGFEYGSNASPLTRGELLAAGNDMIVVALNYRLGALGWADLAHLGGDFEEASNLGLHDLIAGIQWVHENIGTFGGDPTRITVMGESAGSFALCALLAVPRAQPLFSALAAFSGCASRIVPAEVARDLADTILAELDGDPMVAAPSVWLDAQQRANPRDLGVRNAARPRTLGVVDDSGRANGLLSTHPLAAVAGGAWGDKRMLIGTTRDEAAFFPEPADDSRDGLAGDVRAWSDSDRAEEILRAYVADDDGLLSPRRRILTDWIYRLPSVRLADAVADAGGRAYLSLFGREGDTPASHGSDVPGLFGRGEGARARETTALVRAFVTDEMAVEPTGGTRGQTAAILLGDRGIDAAAEYDSVRERWKHVPRP